MKMTNPWRLAGAILAAVFVLAGCKLEPIPLRAYVGSVGIGVSDLEASVAFYKAGLGMTEVERLTRSDRDEVVLQSADGRGSQVVLMHYTDGSPRNYQRNPGKLVYYVSDPNAFALQILAAGGTLIMPPTNQGPALGNAVVGFGRDLDNNLIEFVGSDTAADSYLAAFGIGVSDLEAAKAFYVDVLGMEVEYFLPVPGLYDEYVLKANMTGGSGIVLMHYTNGSERNYTDNPVKLVYLSSDPAQLAHRIKMARERVLAKPAPAEELGGDLVGYAKDPDGYLLEIRQTIRAYLGAAGIGVSDLDASAAFYQAGLGMVEVERRQRPDRVEVVLRSADNRGSQVVLMHVTDGSERNYQRNPGKLVYYVKDPNAFAVQILAAGGSIVMPPTNQGPALGNRVVGFGRDLDNNLIEFVGDDSATASYFGAFGLGVSDLEAAKDFYVGVLGMKVKYFLPVPGLYDEYILEAPGGSALVLMHYTNGSERNYTDNPIKLEFRTVAPHAFADAIADAGMSVLHPPVPDPSRDLAWVGYAKDADGNVLEILLAP